MPGPENFDGDTFAKQKAGLNKVKPAAGGATGPDQAMLKPLMDLYTKQKGDLAALAKETKSSEALMKKKPPKDAKDFAVKMLEGAYALA
ncbi:unnamed protein product [Amoebophrya sp. A120]|nr:unnamed protein product [Amoebophrya sp. A120]|eukprot:GSA120T00014189001.1